MEYLVFVLVIYIAVAIAFYATLFAMKFTEMFSQQNLVFSLCWPVLCVKIVVDEVTHSYRHKILYAKAGIVRKRVRPS